MSTVGVIHKLGEVLGSPKGKKKLSLARGGGIGSGAESGTQRAKETTF